MPALLNTGINNNVADKAAFIKRHLIPIDETIWTEDKFIDFTNARAILIMQKINHYIK